MILLAYIILGHPDWKKGYIKIFVSTSKDKQEEEYQNLVNLIKSGRIPISPKNVEMVISENNNNTNELISQRSMDADLTIVGFQPESMQQGVDAFTGLEDLGNILYVCSNKEKKIQ